MGASERNHLQRCCFASARMVRSLDLFRIPLSPFVTSLAHPLSRAVLTAPVQNESNLSLEHFWSFFCWFKHAKASMAHRHNPDPETLTSTLTLTLTCAPKPYPTFPYPTLPGRKNVHEQSRRHCLANHVGIIHPIVGTSANGSLKKRDSRTL